MPEHSAKLYPGCNAGVCNLVRQWASAVHWRVQHSLCGVEQCSGHTWLFWQFGLFEYYFCSNFRIKRINKNVDFWFLAIITSVQVLACVIVQNGPCHCSIPTLKSYDRWRERPHYLSERFIRPHIKLNYSKSQCSVIKYIMYLSKMC